MLAEFMSIMRFFVVASFLALSAASGLFSAETSPSVQDQSKKKNADDDPKTFLHVSEIASAIRSGKVGSEYAERAKKTPELYVREIVGEKIPYQLFTFNDYRGGYTLLVEADDTFVILCGGYATDFSMTKEKDRTILQFKYITGSGLRIYHTAKYVIGSGASNEVAPTVPKEKR